MLRMTKGAGESSLRLTSGASARARSAAASRRRRKEPGHSNDVFARAFADALQDILKEERRRAA
jgi:hypothetical protein